MLERLITPLSVFQGIKLYTPLYPNHINIKDNCMCIYIIGCKKLKKLKNYMVL